MGGKSFAVALLAVVAFGRVIADGLPISSRDDILKSVSALAEELISYYEGDELGNVPGLLPEDKYFFWESGLFMTSFIDYWRITGDDTYNEPVREGILWQTGDKKDFMPANQSELLTNDDQCTWALAAMTAAEYEFPNPPEDQPQWAALAQAVFDSQRRRLNAEDGEDGTCGGGLRWTISLASPGYDYKNAISSACLLDLGARLARYTGNTTFADTAEDLWAWLEAIALIDTETWAVYDGAQTDFNCTDINRMQFSHSSAVLTHGAAVMYNYTNGSETWQNRVGDLTSSLLDTFFPEGIAVETACEEDHTCTSEMLTYKGIAIRSLASVAQLVPSLSDRILPVLQSSAEAAVSKCADSDSHLLCGFYWVGHGEDDAISARQQMNALSAVASLLIADAEAPSSSLEEPSHGDGIDTEGSAPTEMPNEGIRRSAIGPTVFVLMVSGLVAARWVGLVA